MIALSSKIDTSWPIAVRSPVIVMLSSMYCVYSVPFAAARDENGSAISYTASLRENSVRSGNGFSSSRRQSVTRLEMSLDSRPDCD